MAEKLQSILDEVEAKKKTDLPAGFPVSEPETDDEPVSSEPSKKKNKFLSFIKTIFPFKGDKPLELIRKTVFLGSLITGIICLTMILGDVNATSEHVKQHNEIVDEIKQIELTGKIPLDAKTVDEVKAQVPGILDKYISTYDRNNDMVGFVNIPGTNINYPVMQYRFQREDGAWDGSNVYYLKKDIDHRDSKHGTIYADYNQPVSAEGRPNNTVLYGHNMGDGTMFAHATRYYPYLHSYRGDLSYYINNPLVYFDTLWEEGVYKVFAVMYVHTEENKYDDVYDYFRKHMFPDKESFYDFTVNILDRSAFYNPDVDLEYGDEFLTLSTCYYAPLGENVDARVAVFARRVREGESADVDTTKAYVNTSPLYFKLYYQWLGGTWAGRNWDLSMVKGLEDYIKQNDVVFPQDLAY